MRIKTIFLMTIICLLISISFVSAEEVSYTIDDVKQTITVSGKQENLGYGESVSVLIIKTEQDESAEISSARREKSITQLNNEGVLKAYSQIITDLNGEYKVVFSIDDTGDYLIVVNDSKTDVVHEKYFYYSPRNSKIAFINEMAQIMASAGASPADVKEKFAFEKKEKSNSAKLFGIAGADNIVFSVTENGFADTFFNMINKKAEDADKNIGVYVKEMTPEVFVEEIYTAAKLTTISEGLKTVMDYSDDFSPAADYVKTYNDKVTSEEKETFSKYSKGRMYCSEDEALEVFYDSICFSVISNSRGWSDYKYLIDTHGNDIGIAYMDKYRKLEMPSRITDYLTSNYTDIEKFAKEVDAAILKLSNKGGGSGGSSGGSGGISSSGKLTGKVNNVVEIEVGKNTAPGTNKKVFSDIEDVPWAVESINNLAEKGIINGVGEDKFMPYNNVKREEFVKMAILAAGIVPQYSEMDFADVDKNEWYAAYISAALKSGVISGISEELFGVGREISRQDAAVILYRIAVQKSVVENNGQKNAFNDDDIITDYAQNAVYTLKNMKIINGKSDNMFFPKDSLTRAEAAKMIDGLMLKYKE